MPHGMFRLLRRMPLFQLLAVAQLALQAGRQFQKLAAADRRRLAELVRRGGQIN
jgi:hypothetical protein